MLRTLLLYLCVILESTSYLLFHRTTRIDLRCNCLRLSTRWVSQYAADTVQRIIELMPIYRALEESWTFTLSEDFTERDYGLLRYFIWNKLNSIGVPEKSSLILVHQPPWILSPEDIRQFTLTKSVSTYVNLLTICSINKRYLQLRMLNRMALNDDKGRYTSSERLWAKVAFPLYDI